MRFGFSNPSQALANLRNIRQKEGRPEAAFVEQLVPACGGT
jgi:hypothetical protein